MDYNPIDLIRPNRKITGISAILLPFTESRKIDWAGLGNHILRTAEAGLTPAVNMDTGYANLISEAQRQRVLELTHDVMASRGFVAGAFVADEPGASFDSDAYNKQIETIQGYGGTPIIFQSYGLTGQSGKDIVAAYAQLGQMTDGFIAFELGRMFASFGAIYDLDTYRGLMEIKRCQGAKHSSLSRQQEWDRLVLRDQIRPDFKVFTGNDLAIDMVMYGSDYLLGLSTFAPDLFAKRDAMWLAGDPAFYQLNDLLQYLGFLVFRPPVPAYKHSAAQFLKLRGWIESDQTHPHSPKRPESDMAILKDIAGRFAAEKACYMVAYRRIAQLRSYQQFSDYCQSVGADLPIDKQVVSGQLSPLAEPYDYRERRLSNRFAVLPMEGWDGTAEGHPTELTKRRWRRFGESGAQLIWGGEAVAVRHDGRANARQLVINQDTLKPISDLREALLSAHRQQHSAEDLPLIGLQLTHSGRFCRPNGANLEPLVLYRHPLLDKKFGLQDENCVLSDSEIDVLIEDFGKAAVLAQDAGFDFVDIKHCHGYLGHEFLSAVTRPGKYGGGFENRTRFLRNCVDLIRTQAPGLDIGIRISAVDWAPFHAGKERIGEAMPYNGDGYPFAFGGDGSGVGYDLAEPRRLLALCEKLDIRLICITAGSPYYGFHIQRPAFFPSSDGYLLPEDPLVGVARQIKITAELKAAFPNLTVVGSGYSYLQDWLPNVAQAVIERNMADFVGVGRMALSYPQLPADLLAGRDLQRKRICRTFSDCTTAPRNGMVSGCFPLDEFYKSREEYDRLLAVKKKDAAAQG